MNYEVIIFYKYVTIENPAKLMEKIRERCLGLNLLGRVIVAGEGINATLEGKPSDIVVFVEEFTNDPRFKDVSIKRSRSDGKTFPRLSVKVRKEIVGTHFVREEANPEVKSAPRIKPEELRTWYESGKDFIIIDMRNSYEFDSGHFWNAIDPGLQNSRDLPKVVEKFVPLKGKTVLTVCTAGVRCEKMSAYLLGRGFKEVYQLDGGIHSYMEKYPGKDFLGTLYTFDQRVTMHFGGEREVVGRCRRCGKKTETYYNCGNDDCHLHFLMCNDCSVPRQNVFCSVACQKTLAEQPEASPSFL